MVLSTLLVYLAVYAVLTALYIGVLFHLARKGTALAGPPGSDNAASVGALRSAA